MCTHGWVGEACTIPCPGLEDEMGVCSGHGACRASGEGSVCECMKGLTGVYLKFEGESHALSAVRIVCDVRPRGCRGRRGLALDLVGK